MAQAATKPAKLSKEEMWLEKRFQMKIAKLDPDFLEGGKKHDEFTSKLAVFKVTFSVLEKRFEEFKKMKIDPQDKAKARIAASLPKDFKAIETMAKKGDFKSTGKAMMEWNGDFGSLTMSKGVDASPELDHRSFAGGSNR
jgi:hypothetical protein